MIGIFLDTETNGLDCFKHRILEIAFTLIDLKTRETLFEYSSIVLQPLEVFDSSDPTSLYINGFTYEKVALGKEESTIASEIKKIFKDFKIRRETAVFICQNPSFDRSFFSQLIPSLVQEELKWPYHWLDFASMFFALQYAKEKEPWSIGFSKDKIAGHLQLPPENRPHHAKNGVNHLIACFNTLFKPNS